MDEELIRLMKNSNCTRVRLAIEHGDQEFLDKEVNKNLNLSKLKESVRLMRKYKIAVDGFFILGLPGETNRTIRKNIDFTKELSAMGVNPVIGMFIPLLGSQMYDDV
eukprot:GHVR01021838.1.p1 GENE.GHVR01021838.1~~GHVR01021838.1.p1  ORF type:complete len:107 (+),score=19.28 GHVR01021838.1:299-619(+)